MVAKRYIIFLILSCVLVGSQAQDTLSFSADTIPVSTKVVRFSPDSLDAKVEYGARDSMYFDNINRLVYLWGGAYVNYTSLSLTAGFILIDLANNLATAEGFKDTSGTITELPVFKDGEQEFQAHRLRYNFKTGKGKIYDVSSQQNDVYIHGGETKFIRTLIDSTQTYIGFNSDAVFTTCNLEEPHFGIHSNKQKFIPDKLIVVGPSNLIIANVPTPIFLPFGFFPLSKGKKSGLIFPKDYEYSTQWGFGLKGIGYYIPLGDHFDLTVSGDIYWKGTWGVNLASSYKKKYRYDGRLEVGYSNRIQEDELAVIQKEKSYNLRWSYNRDSRSHPTIRFNSNVNIQTNNYNSLNRNDYNSVFNNTLSSNASFGKTFPGKPYSFSVSMSHSQNNNTRVMQIDLPKFDFQLQRIYPFKNKERVGKEKWFDKISFQYRNSAQNQFITTDTTLFSKETLKNAKYGAKHEMSSDAPFRILKYFNLTPSVNYSEYWYFKTIRKEVDPTPLIMVDTIKGPDFEENPLDYRLSNDTIQYSQIDTFYDANFKALRQFNAGISMNTQLFGTIKFKKGWLRGIRHVVKPSVGFNFTPDYTDPRWGYFDYVSSDIRPGYEDSIRYSYFEGGVYNTLPSSSGLQMALNYSINSIFEAKYHSKKDSMDRKFKIFDNITAGGNYNFAADSLNFSPVTVNGTLRLFKGITTLSVQSSFDPYIVRNGVRVNEFYWDNRQLPLRFTRLNINLNSTLRFGQIREFLTNEPDQEETTTTGQEDFLSLFESFGLNHTFSYQRIIDGFRDTVLITNSLNLQGDIQLTKGWRITVGNIGYDFVSNKVVYPDFGFYRDLHCWEMGLNWQPERGTYTFFLRVKPGTLDFIKVPYNRNNADAFKGF